MKLTLVRHTTPDVPKGVFYGRTDVGLRPTFQKEAAFAKDKLAGLKFDKVFCSPRQRCVRLAEFCGFSDMEITEEIAEMNFGEWEMKSYSTITGNEIEEYFQNWKETIPPGGESFKQQGERVRRFISNCIEEKLSNILLFTHGGTILHTMIIAGIIDDTRPFDYTPAFGSVTEIEIEDL